MRVLERWYVKSKEDGSKTMSFGSKILHDGSEIPSWYPSNQLTSAQAAYIVTHKDKFYFNVYEVPENEQLVQKKGATATTKTTQKGFKKAPAATPAVDAELDALFGGQ